METVISLNKNLEPKTRIKVSALHHVRGVGIVIEGDIIEGSMSTTVELLVNSVFDENKSEGTIKCVIPYCKNYRRAIIYYCAEHNNYPNVIGVGTGYAWVIKGMTPKIGDILIRYESLNNT